MNTLSLRLRPLAAAIFCSLLAPVLFAQTATTTPVGFITRTIPSAFDASTPSYTPFSVPLYQTAAFQGAVAGTPVAGSHDIKLSGAAFPANQYSASPHLLRVKTGALVGKFWTVISHTADTLSLKEPLGGSPGIPDANLSGLLEMDSCEILPANTFGTTLGTISGLGTGSSASGPTADNVLVWNGSSFEAYFYHTTNSRWQKGISNATNTVIFPDDTLFFARKVVSPLTLTFMGTVPSTTERTELAGSSYNFVGNRFPTDTTLGATGLENTTGWVKRDERKRFG